MFWCECQLNLCVMLTNLILLCITQLPKQWNARSSCLFTLISFLVVSLLRQMEKYLWLATDHSVTLSSVTLGLYSQMCIRLLKRNGKKVESIGIIPIRYYFTFSSISARIQIQKGQGSRKSSQHQSLLSTFIIQTL